MKLGHFWMTNYANPTKRIPLRQRMQWHFLGLRQGVERRAFYGFAVTVYAFNRRVGFGFRPRTFLPKVAR